MGTDAMDASYYGSFRVDYDKTTRKLTASLVIDGVAQTINLIKAEISPESPSGILLTASSIKNNPSIELSSSVFPSRSSYDYVELSYDGRRPNPRVIVRVNIP
jgi:hypothetical protein